MEGNLFIFLVSAVIISLSGVLSPGPMTAAVIQQGARSPLTGLYVSLGHGVVELPLIALLYAGASQVLEMEGVRIAVGLAGGAYLLVMARGLLRPGHLDDLAAEKPPSSFVTGIVVSAANPYFLLWWATIGLGLVMGAARFGLPGLGLFALAHWLADLLWYSFLSMVAFSGVKRFGDRLYRRVSAVCGVTLIFFGGTFIWKSLVLLLP